MALLGRRPAINDWEYLIVFKPFSVSLLVLSLALLVSACGSKSPRAPDATAAAHPLPTTSFAAVDLAGIRKAEGGKTVAEVYADKDQLAGQSVSVHGKVVKTHPTVMGKNWLHVRDGSGTDKTDDLTVTTLGPLPSVGETVLVTGTLAVNKNLGLGYQYEVLLEDAKVTTE